MKRREYLKRTTAAALLGVAGCVDNNSSDTVDQTLGLGQASVRSNVKIGVLGYTLIDKFAVYERSEPRETQSFTPAEFTTPQKPGAQFLLAFIVGTHEGTATQYFPSGEEDSVLYYDSEPVNNFLPPYVFTDGQREYGSYYGGISQAKAKERGAYPPFGAQGYQVYEVPREFDPSLVEIEVTWGWKRNDRGLYGGGSTRWKINTEAQNETAGEPPTSATHGESVQTRDQQYETSQEGDGYTPTYDTISGTYTYTEEDEES